MHASRQWIACCIFLCPLRTMREHVHSSIVLYVWVLKLKKHTHTDTLTQLLNETIKQANKQRMSSLFHFALLSAEWTIAMHIYFILAKSIAFVDFSINANEAQKYNTTIFFYISSPASVEFSYFNDVFCMCCWFLFLLFYWIPRLLLLSFCWIFTDFFFRSEKRRRRRN